MKKEDLNLQIRAPLSQDLVEEGKWEMVVRTP
jgi:hypothetical protein